MKRLLTVALLAVLAVSWNALAQENQISGLVGRTFISDQGVKSPPGLLNPTVHFGNGLTFEVNYGRHVLGQGFTRLSLEVPAVFNLDEDLNGPNVIPESYKSFFVTPSARANFFAMTAIQPWLSFGGGFGHFSESSNLVFGGSNPGKTGTTTGVLQFGGGLDVRFKPRWALRGEFRDFYSGVPQLNVDTGKSRQHNYFVGGGLIWFFGK